MHVFGEQAELISVILLILRLILQLPGFLVQFFLDVLFIDYLFSSDPVEGQESAGETQVLWFLSVIDDVWVNFLAVEEVAQFETFD